MTRVASDREEGMGPDVDDYVAEWFEAREIPETDPPRPLFFAKGTDGTVYLDGHPTTISLLS